MTQPITDASFTAEVAKRITLTRRKNLERLAAYLQSLDADYEEFDMRSFFDGNSEMTVHYARYNGSVAKCGSAACAVGHGPSAGLFLGDSEIAVGRYNFANVSWDRYAERVFIGKSSDYQDHVFGFLFGGDWNRLDGHHYGAAARIRYFLDKGLPPVKLAQSEWHEEDDPDIDYDGRIEPAYYAGYLIKHQVHLPDNFYTPGMLKRFAIGEKKLLELL